LELVGEWYVADRNPRWVRRNALLVLGNSGVRNDNVVTALARYLHGDDELLREHAQWAAHRLGLSVSMASERVP
jgi:epoxyqueuosine reductase